MASNESIGLMAHLMRRAGFGATRSGLERMAEQGYDETVETAPQPGECSGGRHQYALPVPSLI